MKRRRFSEEQIIGVLKEHQAGMSAVDLCRKHGISDATFYTWRSKYGVLGSGLAILHMSRERCGAAWPLRSKFVVAIYNLTARNNAH